MLILGYNIPTNYLIYTILFIILCVIFGIFLSYMILRYVRMGCDDYGIFFNQYNKKTQSAIELYGDCRIVRAYLVRVPPPKIMTLIINIFTLFKYEDYIKQSTDYLPYHARMILEIKYKNMSKFILIDKTHNIDVCETFMIDRVHEMISVKIHGRHTILSVLTETNNRIGSRDFFNWNLFQNNCQAFMKEMLITLGKFNNKTRKFICRDKMLNLVVSPTDFSIHTLNCLHICNNICEKYIFDKISFH